MEYTALGLPLVGLSEEENYTVHPLHALVIMEGMDSDGDEICTVLMTENMTPMRGMALARLADVFCENKVKDSLAASRQSQEE